MSKSVAETNGYYCDVCGKFHYRRPGNIYRISYNGLIRHCCGYNCYNKLHTLIKEKRYEEADKILAEHQVDDSGLLR